MLIGRDTELQLARDTIAAVRSGRGARLLIVGDTGAGKTAFVDRIALDSTDTIVLRAAGSPTETGLPYAGLLDLLQPCLGRIDDLRPAYAAALRGAVGLGPAAAGDRLAVFGAFVELVGAASTTRPVVVVVDDHQWLDPDTAECLAYLARRVHALPVAIVVATTPPPPAMAGDVVVDLPPLPAESARRLVEHHHRDLAPSVAESIVGLAGGNPLALVSLPGALDTDIRAGITALPTPLPLDAALTGAYRRRLDVLDQPTRDLLVLLALDGDGVRRSIDDVLAVAGIGADALANAEGARLVAITGGRVRLVHPIVGSIIVAQTDPARIRWAHGILAAALPPHAAAWHRAAAAVGPDETIARALDDAAEDALRRRSPRRAADGFERAAAFSTDDRARARRLHAAGTSAFTAGEGTRAITLLDAAARLAEPAIAADAEHLAGTAAMWFGNVEDGHRRLVTAAERHEHDHAPEAALMLADAALAATAWDCRRALVLADRGWALAQGAGDEARAVAGTALVWCRTLRGQAREAAELFATVEPLLGAVDPSTPRAQSLAVALNVRIASEDYAGARAMASFFAEVAADSGAPSGRAMPLLLAADAARRMGHWNDVVEPLESSLAIAHETGQRGTESLGEAALALFLAGVGDEAGCRAAAERLAAIAGPLGMRSADIFAGSALGLLELGLGRLTAATGHLEQVAAAADAQGFAEPLFLPWIPDFVECHVRMGDLDAAAARTDQLAAICEGVHTAGAHALLARCHGLVSGDDAHFVTALEHHAAAGMPFETARTMLVRGEALRRRTRKAPARTSLAEAATIFESLGARPWEARTRSELAAIDPVRDGRPLTERQWQMVRLVARGARNREIAAELFVSEKTVEHHLAQAFRAAGVRSRTELAAWVHAQE